MIGRYEAGDDEGGQLGKLIEAGNAAHAAAQRKVSTMRSKLLALGVTPAQLEQAIGVFTLTDNLGGMPRGHIIGMTPVEAAEAVLAGAAQLLPEHPFQKPPAWFAKAIASLQGAEAAPEQAKVAPAELSPAVVEQLPAEQRAALVTPEQIAACGDVAQLEKWIDAEASLGTAGRPAIIDGLNARIEMLFADQVAPPSPAPKVTPAETPKSKTSKAGKR